LLKSCVVRAAALDIIIGASIGTEPVYSLTFPDGSSWADRWTSTSNLSLSELEYIFNVIEEYEREEARVAALEIGSMMVRRETE
jgi:hypothetical protein